MGELSHDERENSIPAPPDAPALLRLSQRYGSGTQRDSAIRRLSTSEQAVANTLNLTEDSKSPSKWRTSSSEERGRAPTSKEEGRPTMGLSSVVALRMGTEEIVNVLKDQLGEPSENSTLILSKQAETVADEVVRERSRKSTPSDSVSSFKGASVAKKERVNVPLRSNVELPELVSMGSRHCWSALAPSNFGVRGPKYLKDRVKKPSSTQSQLLAVELFRTKQAVPNVAGRVESPVASLHQRCASALSIIFVVVLVIPTGKSVVRLAMYYGVYDSMERETPSASTLLNRFVNADDAWRSKRFKIIPKVDCMIQRRVATRHALSESQHHSARWQGAAGVQQQCLSSHRQPVCNTDS